MSSQGQGQGAPSTIVVWLAPRPGATPVPNTVPAPTLAPDDVLVQVEAAALAAPELRAIDRGPGADGRPVAPGEAAVGLVVAAGEAAADLAGKRVLVGPVDACAECEACRRGHPMVCPAARRRGTDIHGTFATHVVARARWVLALDGPLAGAAPGPAAAALPRDAALAATLFARAGVAPGEATVWLGDGHVAALGRAIAAARGAQALSPTGDELALHPAALERALRARLSAESGPAGPWKVFETSGRDAGRRRALGIVAAGPAGGTVVLVAGAAAGTVDDHPLALAPVLDADATIVAVAGAHPDLLPETVALAARGELDLAAVVTEVPIASLAAAITALRTGEGAGRLHVVTGFDSTAVPRP